LYPDWVLKHRTKGTNISLIDGRYYLYEVGSVWNKEKKRAQKITKKYLGRITEDGLVAPKIKAEKISTPVSVKEYGASAVVAELGRDILSKLREIFPKQAETLFALAVLRVIERALFRISLAEQASMTLSQVHQLSAKTFKNGTSLTT